MSFILDALRKSESDRRRDATPSLAQIPPAAPRNNAPDWVWIVMGALVLGVLGLAALWWRSTETASLPEVEAARAAPAEPFPAAEGRAGAEPRVSAPPSGAPPGPADGRTASRADPGNLPSVAEARASGLALPELKLQLISYSEDETQRFVFINGFRYRQGQRVQNGPLVVSIARDSVVLEQQGRDFRLTPE